MSLLKPLGEKFPIERQLGVEAEPVVLVNEFTLDATDTPAFLNAEFMKHQRGFISTQFHRTISDNPTSRKYAVWKSTAVFRAAFTHPEFIAKLSTYLSPRSICSRRLLWPVSVPPNPIRVRRK